MDSKKCSVCNETKSLDEFYTQVTSKKNKLGVLTKYRAYQSRCKGCKGVKKSYGYSAETLDGMIEYAKSLGFKSASYAIDKYGKEQFKQMYYDNRETKI